MKTDPLIKYFVKIVVAILMVLSPGCNKPTEPPPPENYALEIIAVDASCTEVWLEIKSPEIELPQLFTLTENGEEKGSVTINKADTTLLIENLLPNKNYKYQLKNTEHKSNETEITTLDTTSHNFTWQTFEFGQHSSSVLYDVAIIDENNIWAVGEIYMNDANNNPDPKSYNAAHWDGQRWELIKMGGYGGYPRRTVFAFSENDVWFEGTIKWDGERYTVHQNGFPLMPNGDGWQINKMWGSSSNDLYAVGNGGNIAHWNGSSWKKIESGTSTNINDILGIIDKQNEREIIYCSVSFVFDPGDQKILTLNGFHVDSIKWNTGRGVHSVWTKKGNVLYTAGGGVFENKQGFWKEIKDIPPYYSRCIRGTDYNNLFVSGDFGLISHYNGTSWKTVSQYTSGLNMSISVKDNILIVVGLKGSKAIITKGFRN